MTVWEREKAGKKRVGVLWYGNGKVTCCVSRKCEMTLYNSDTGDERCGKWQSEANGESGNRE